MSGKSGKVRRATQLLTCRAVLAKFLEGETLERCLLELRHAMRQGPQAWAFKPKDEVPEDERVYYESGGAT